MEKNKYSSPEAGIIVVLPAEQAILSGSPTGEGYGEPEEFGGF